MPLDKYEPSKSYFEVISLLSPRFEMSLAAVTEDLENSKKQCESLLVKLKDSLAVSQQLKTDYENKLSTAYERVNSLQGQVR